MPGTPTPEDISVTDFGYDAPAEFYGWKSQGKGRGAVTFRRFATGAEAVRHAIEDVPVAALGSCVLEVNGKRFRGQEIRTLYVSRKFSQRRTSLRLTTEEKING